MYRVFYIYIKKDFINKYVYILKNIWLVSV